MTDLWLPPKGGEASLLDSASPVPLLLRKERKNMSNPEYTPRRMRGYTDTDLICALEDAAKKGSCPGLVNDDNGHWAVSETGFQNCPRNTPVDIDTSFFVKKKEWKNSVREALVYWIERKKK